MNALTMTGRHHAQRGSVAVEAAFMVPVMLTGLMMLFEIARLGLVMIVGNLALETAMAALRQDTTLDFTDTGLVAERVKERMLAASHGYLTADEILVKVESYKNLSAFGAALSPENAEEGSKNKQEEESRDSEVFPVLTVDVDLTQQWITALPELLGFDAAYAHTYHHVLGNLYRQTEEDSR